MKWLTTLTWWKMRLKRCQEEQCILLPRQHQRGSRPTCTGVTPSSKQPWLNLSPEPAIQTNFRHVHSARHLFRLMWDINHTPWLKLFKPVMVSIRFPTFCLEIWQRGRPENRAIRNISPTPRLSETSGRLAANDVKTSPYLSGGGWRCSVLGKQTVYNT